MTVEAWGGGGAGGGATNNPAKGGGGAGGQYASKAVTVVPGNSYSVVVGAGGAAQRALGQAVVIRHFRRTWWSPRGGRAEQVQRTVLPELDLPRAGSAQPSMQAAVDRMAR